MSRVLVLACLIGLCTISKAGQFVISGSGGHPGLTDAESTRTIRVAESTDGKHIQVNGTATTVEGFRSALHEFTKQRGVIWYHRKLPLPPSGDEPLTTAIVAVGDPKSDPAGAEVLQIAAAYHLPVRFSAKPDFVEGNTREVQTLSAVTITTPFPEYPPSLKERGFGGSGVFHQHIDTETGLVTSVTVKQSTGSAALDRYALAALRQWKYRTSAKFSTVAVPVTFVASRSGSKR